MQDQLQDKALKEIVLNVDDIRNLREFLNHFKVEIIPELDAAMTTWESKKDKVTLEDQEKLRIALCKTMLTSEHRMFKDELFVPILASSEKIVFESTFKEELENQLARPTDSQE